MKDRPKTVTKLTSFSLKNQGGEGAFPRGLTVSQKDEN